MERNREFNSLESVFAALPEKLQEHSMRVEKYADLIFMELCAAEEYLINLNSRVRLKTENRSVIGLAARYHDLGKVFLPEIYHDYNEEYVPEELALYRRHSAAGEELVRKVTENKSGIVPMTVDVICESVGRHHERWDGKGYPIGTRDEGTPVVARIVAVADALDHRLMTTRDENPVHTVIERMMYDSGSAYDPVIMGLLYDAKYKVDRIFSLYREQSRAIAQTPKIIKRKASRPLYLKYRPIIDLNTKKVIATEAKMKFKRGRDEVGFEEVVELLRQNKNIYDAGLCFVLEAADAARRFKTCEIGGEYLTLECVTGFFRRRGMATAVIKMVNEIECEPAKLCFMINPRDMVDGATANIVENCKKLRAAGFKVMYTGTSVADTDIEMLRKMCITHIKLDAADIETTDSIHKLIIMYDDLKLSIISDGLDKKRLVKSLHINQVEIATGNLVSDFETEDNFVTREIAVAEKVYG